MNGTTLADIVSRHEEWVHSGFRAGERAVLEGADLREVNLAGVDLRQADLTNADLRGADLGRSRLNGATLRGAILRDAVLNGVDFTNDTDTVKSSTPLIGPAATDLEGADIGGADMTVALLPRDAPIHRCLREAANAARGALRIGSILTLLLALAVAALLRTRDADLLRDPPLLSVPLTVVYWLAPLAFLFLYGWWHFSYLDRLWRAAARLPAFLPEGPALSAHPPLRPFSSWIAGHMPLLVEASESRWDKVRGWAIGFLIWWLVPVILLAIWWRYLVLHEPIGTFVHVAVTAAALAISGSWRSTALHRFHSTKTNHGAARPVLAALVTALALAGFSYPALEMNAPPSFRRGLEVRFEDFSRPSPLALRDRNLRFAALAYCSLREADFSGARLEGASLTVSDLTSADLRNADLRGATLFSTRLENARIEGANLAGANLRCASGLTGRQLAAAITDASTTFPDGSQGPFQAGANVTRVDPLDCTHWRPDGTQMPPDMIERLQRFQQELPEIDLSPIPELGPSASPDAAGEEPTGESPDAIDN